MNAHPELFPWFIGTWIILGLCNVWLLIFNKNIALKKRFLPILNIGVGILFIVFVFLMTGEPKIMLIVIPATALISFLNLRTIRFCEACGQTLFWYTKPEYCSKCGVKLIQNHD